MKIYMSFVLNQFNPIHINNIYEIYEFFIIDFPNPISIQIDLFSIRLVVMTDTHFHAL